MTDELVIPTTGTRVPPLPRSRMNPDVEAAYELSIATWGIPSNLFRTMAHHPALAITEVPYANSVIFDAGELTDIPNPDTEHGSTVRYPTSGFLDRVTKELVINVVSLLNRSRYSMTHHTVIGYNTLSELLPHPDPETRARMAEQMLLHLVDEHGNPAFDQPDAPPYTPLHLACLHLAVATQAHPHAVTDDQVRDTHHVLLDHAPAAITAHGLDEYPGTDTPAYHNAYATGMLVELTWLAVHFSGLLNTWFTVLHTYDEASVPDDEIDFIAVYNTTVPTSIRRRNNALLGPTGWGNTHPHTAPAPREPVATSER
ncbi:hypothetical protein [Saccharothrix xinjiangensis]|uniref:Uncharacterized protein n=1 Tax=Saccharothrix xinjiangensis TaxID=204798 RepID=A0ABV9XY09_9PSEU